MKKIIFIVGFCLIAVLSFGQRTITDTLQGNEVVAFSAMSNASVVSVLCTQLGGTSDGEVYVQGSVDGTSYETLQFDVNDQFIYSNTDNDTLTITNGAIWLVDLSKLKFPYYRIEGDGTASDTTLITIKWSK
jgi:hypothetical protein